MTDNLHLIYVISFFTICWFPTVVVADKKVSHKTETKKSFKGWELYSWQNKQSGIWNFSLLHGTNRNKTENEIKSSEVAKDIQALKIELKQVAPNENVFWLLNGAEGLEYPPDVMVNEIIDIGKKNGFIISK